MGRPIYIGVDVLELSKLHMYETNYDKLQPYFEQIKFQINYMDCDFFVLSIETQSII